MAVVTQSKQFCEVLKNWTPTLLPCITTLLGVGMGYWLGLMGETKREKRNKDNANAELMRALLQETSSNRIKCQTISTNQEANSYLDFYIWDRIRISDTLYHCITMKNADIYQRIITVYVGIQNINFKIAAYLSALDSFIRAGGTIPPDMKNATYKLLRETVIVFLPQLTAIENAYKDFLIAESFFSQSKSKMLRDKTK